MTEAEIDEVCRQFGLRLVLARQRLGRSQNWLALETGMSHSHLSGIEHGHRNLGVATVSRIAKALGVKPYVLMDYDDDLTAPNVGDISRPD